jgi:WD40 repeat protein
MAQYTNRVKQSPFNGHYVAACSSGGSVLVFFNLTLFRNFTNSFHAKDFEWINENSMAIAGYDSTIRIVSTITGQIVRTINTAYQDQFVTSLKMLSNGIHLASGHGYYEACSPCSQTGNITIYNINTGSLIVTLPQEGQNVYNLELLSNGTLLASTNWEGVVIWNLTTNTRKFVLVGHTDYIYGLKEVSSDVLASASVDKTIILWNITTGLEIRTLFGHTSALFWAIDILSDGQTLISSSGGGGQSGNAYYTSSENPNQIKIWNWKTGECLNTIQPSDYYQYITGLSLIVLKPKKGKIIGIVFTYTI